MISFDRAITHGGSRKNLLGPDRDADDELAKKLSSENNVTEKTPPTFIFQTDADTVVPAENAVRFYLALRAKKVPAEMHIYEAGPHGVGLYLADPILGTWSGHLADWLRSHFFYAPAQPRAAVSGEVLLDGKPVSWGTVVFRPGDKNLPATAVRVRGGTFSAEAGEGPVTAKSSLTFEGSIWETTGSPDDQLVRLASLKPGGPAVSVEVGAAADPMRFEFSSK